MGLCWYQAPNLCPPPSTELLGWRNRSRVLGMSYPGCGPLPPSCFRASPVCWTWPLLPRRCLGQGRRHPCCATAAFWPRPPEGVPRGKKRSASLEKCCRCWGRLPSRSALSGPVGGPRGSCARGVLPMGIAGASRTFPGSAWATRAERVLVLRSRVVPGRGRWWPATCGRMVSAWVGRFSCADRQVPRRDYLLRRVRPVPRVGVPRPTSPGCPPRVSPGSQRLWGWRGTRQGPLRRVLVD